MEPDNKTQLLQELACLQKMAWSLKDVKSFFHCWEGKAEKIIKRAKAGGGAVPYDRRKVLSDVVIEIESKRKTTRDREIANRVSELFGPSAGDRAQSAARGAKA
jgi:hypothetical protein